MAKVIRKRTFGGVPAVDFLDNAYLMPLLCAASLRESDEYPFKYGPFFRFGAQIRQSGGRMMRWQAYQSYIRGLMTTQDEAEDVRSNAFAKWVASLYEGRQYPYVLLGPPLASLAYLAAILDAPFLPLNYALAVRHPKMNPDGVKEQVERAKKIASFLLKYDNNIQIVNEYDPVHDRLKMTHGTQLRCRFKSLPPAYDSFIRTHLRQNGTVMIVESRIGWRQYKIADDFYHQVGRPGGLPCEEYLFGSKRLNIFRARFLQDEGAYRLGRPDELQPESQYGVTPAIRLSAIDCANKYNRNICQLFSDDIYLVNNLVSSLFIRCARREGFRPKYAYIHSGNFIAPYLCLRSTLLPIWAPTPCFPAFEFVRSHLKRYPFDLEEILVSFQPSIEEAPDFYQINRWTEMLQEHAKVRFIGMNPKLYPREMSAYFNFWPRLSSWSKKHKQPLNIRVSSDIVIEEAEKAGIYFQVTENTAPGAGPACTD
jgi:hypothetical protein